MIIVIFFQQCHLLLLWEMSKGLCGSKMPGTLIVLLCLVGVVLLVWFFFFPCFFQGSITALFTGYNVYETEPSFWETGHYYSPVMWYYLWPQTWNICLYMCRQMCFLFNLSFCQCHSRCFTAKCKSSMWQTMSRNDALCFILLNFLFICFGVLRVFTSCLCFCMASLF